MATIFEQGVAKIETALKSLETAAEGFLKDTVEPAVKAELAIIGPQILGLGETVLSQIWQAAETYLMEGGPLNPGAAPDALRVLAAQLPADLQALEHIVMAAFSGAVQSIQAKKAAASA